MRSPFFITAFFTTRAVNDPLRRTRALEDEITELRKEHERLRARMDTSMLPVFEHAKLTMLFNDTERRLLARVLVLTEDRIALAQRQMEFAAEKHDAATARIWLDKVRKEQEFERLLIDGLTPKTL